MGVSEPDLLKLVEGFKCAWEQVDLELVADGNDDLFRAETNNKKRNDGNKKAKPKREVKKEKKANAANKKQKKH